MTWWKWKVFERDLGRVDVVKTAEAEKDLEHRKLRGAAVHAEAKHIVERNNLAEKFHAAMTLKGKNT